MGETWYYWNTGTCDSTATSTTYTAGNDTWVTWASTTTSTTATNTVWVTWATTGTGTNLYVQGDQRTAEQKAADEARWAAELEAGRQRWAEAEKMRKTAAARARALLLSMLSVKQREQLQRDRFFEVIAQGSKRRYRIHQGTHGNVKLLDDTGREVTSYCAQPPDVPAEDAMLAQKLMLELHEEDFLRVANARRVA